MEETDLKESINLVKKYNKMTPKERDQIKRQRFYAMVTFARKHNPLYAKLYENLGVNFFMRDVPYVERDFLLSNKDIWQSDEVIPSFIPQAINTVRSFTFASDYRRFLLHGSRYVIISSSDGALQQAAWPKSTTVLSVFLPIEEMTKQLNELRPAFLWAYPSTLEKLLEHKDDKKFLARLRQIKKDNKLALASYIKEHEGVEIDPESIFDIQIKRMHEYKRQQMNALYIIHRYLEIKKGKKPDSKVTFIFGAKAAPAYIIAQDIIHLILCLSEIINNDPEVNEFMKVVMVENYNVSYAERLIPACDISEQISLASKEASGTGNMKFMLNVAVTLGTDDGANVEIHELVGDDNIYIFGEKSDVVIKHYEKADYISKDYYKKSKVIKEAVDFIVDKQVIKVGNKTMLTRLYNELLNKDWFMTLLDLEDYIKVKDKMLSDYADKDRWDQMMLNNIAKAGFFSSDRTIKQYDEDIWHLGTSV